MNGEYKVAWYINSTYQVLNRETYEQMHQGSLSDCEAWIRLQEGGYFD
jgi:hypothetical protein